MQWDQHTKTTRGLKFTCCFIVFWASKTPCFPLIFLYLYLTPANWVRLSFLEQIVILFILSFCARMPRYWKFQLPCKCKAFGCDLIAAIIALCALWRKYQVLMWCWHCSRGHIHILPFLGWTLACLQSQMYNAYLRLKYMAVSLGIIKSVEQHGRNYVQVLLPSAAYWHKAHGCRLIAEDRFSLNSPS